MRRMAIVLAGVACALSAGLAQARDVYWSVGVSSPGVGAVFSNAPPVHVVQPAVVYAPPPVVHAPPAPVYYVPPAPRVVYRPVVVHQPVVVYGKGHHKHHRHHWRHRHGHHDGHGHWHRDHRNHRHDD